MHRFRSRVLNMAVVAGPRKDRLVVLTEKGVYYSTDGGKRWRRVNL